MLSKTFFTLSVLASCALAQSSTASSSAAEPSTSLPASITPCILNCVQPAAQAVGCNFADATCVCKSNQFQQQARQCLEQKSTTEEQQAALGLQAQECGAIGATPPGSVTDSATTEAVSSSTGASESTSAPLTSSRASSVVQNSSTRPTSTAPVSNPSPSVSKSASTPEHTTNAAIGKSDGMGLISLIVAGFFGLVF